MTFSGTLKTPAPTRVVPANVAGSQKIAADSYGQNGVATPSSVAPGSRVVSKLGENMRDSAGDDVLLSVMANGSRIPSPQTRNVSPTPFPTTVGCKDANANNPKVPGSIGTSDGQP